MRVPRTERPEHIIGFSAATALGATITQSVITQQQSSQLQSEILGWAVFLIIVKHVRRPKTKAGSGNHSLQCEAESRTVTGSCWIVGVSVATATLCSAENRLDAIVLPALTPLLLLVEKKLHLPQPVSEIRESTSWADSTTTIWGAFVISLFGVHSLARWSLPSLALATIELIALLALYGTLLPKLAPKSNAIPFVNIESSIELLAPRVIATLLTTMVFQTLLLGFAPFQPGTALLAGVGKAFTWYFSMETARHLSWTAVVVIRVFAIFASRNPFTQSFERQALSNIACSSLSLGQLIALIPKQVANRRLLWALLLIPILPYLLNVLAIRAASSRAVVFASTHSHPIDTIIQQANADFDTLLRRQSETYAAACEEYRRRYQMEPPPGFEKWFEFAKSHDSKVIDDFDVMYESIRPLWSLSGRQILQTMRQLQLSSENEIWTCKFSGQTLNTGCVHSWRSFDRHMSKLFNQLMGDTRGTLPDVEFLVNHLDEPRVIFPAAEEQPRHNSDIKVRNLMQSSTWKALVQYCNQPGYNETATRFKSTVNSFDLPFIRDLSLSRDLCKHPEYRNMHGLLMSPTSFRLIEGMVPVLSTGSPSTMSDILFPSSAYIEPEFVYNEKHDLDWSEKQNKVYWAGSTSGAYSKDSDWKNYHRQRFVSLVQILDGKEHAYLADKGGFVQRVTSRFLNSRLFDVAFTKVYQCAKKPCREQSFFYRMTAWADKDESLRSRLSFDIDGNGISGRWYKLLASKSAPLKQTLLREWHDDRLLPWVHYIPVSIGMEELPELVMYFTSTEQGQQRAKEIAERGRNWFFQALRGADMSVYMYRLILELARLQDPERQVI